MKNPLIIIRIGTTVMDTRDSQTTKQAVDKFLKLYPGHDRKYVKAKIKFR
jgi:hypothetical protein